MSHKIYFRATAISDSMIPKQWAPVDKTLKIQPFGKDNAYPQRVENILKKSAIGVACVDLFYRFIKGSGFTDEQFSSLIINHKKETPDKLLRKVTKDYAKWRGFAIHANYNALAEIDSINYIPFEYCRRGEPDDLEFVNKIAVYNDWTRYKHRNLKRKTIDYIDTFNPDPDAVLAQIERAGGIDKYKGQVFYWSDEDGDYPLASFDSVLKDLETDGEVSTFKNSNVKTNFLASHIIEYPGKFSKESEKAEFEKKLQAFQGAKNASKLFLVENESLQPDGKGGIKIHSVSIQDSDKLYEYTETSTHKRIRMNYSIPPVLLGDLIPGKLGASKEIEDAVKFYNRHTEDDRAVFEEAFQVIFTHWKSEVSADFSIQELVYGSEDDAEAEDSDITEQEEQQRLVDVVIEEIENRKR